MKVTRETHAQICLFFFRIEFGSDLLAGFTNRPSVFDILHVDTRSNVNSSNAVQFHF